MMYQNGRQQIIDTGIALDRYRLISLSGGNVSMRFEGHILVTPSGMSYETLVPADVVVMDTKGKVIEGERRPSVDTVALLHIYNHIPSPCLG
jgi:L-ribulose-5-phosphate 4-epimerase